MPARLLLILTLLTPALSVRAESRGGVPEPVAWLQEYLQVDTTNPPGNERPAAELLARILEREGIPARLLTSPEGRTSLYARWVSPSSGGRAIALVHHVDVVPAGEGWQTEPFSGRPWAERVWGRGAIDAKSLGIAALSALVSCRREGVDLGYDVLFLAVADEERGGGQGMGWLLEAHPDLFEGLEGVLNEGGSNRTFDGRVLWWGVEVTQKRPLWLRLSVSARGGHGAGWNPGSATHQLVTALARLVERPPRYRVSDAARRFLEAMAEVEGAGMRKLAESLDEVILEDGPTSPLPPGMPTYFLDTLQVTEIDNGSRGPNVVPPEASALVDVRLLPDTDAEAFLTSLEETTGPSVEVEVLLESPPAPASPTVHPLYRAVERVLSVRAPVVALFVAGTTDSRYFRERGIPAYGIQPFALDPSDTKGIHAVDERIPTAVLLRGVESMRRILLAYSGEESPPAPPFSKGGS